VTSCIVRSNCFVLGGQGKDPTTTTDSGSNDDASDAEGSTSSVGNTVVGNVEKVGEEEGSSDVSLRKDEGAYVVLVSSTTAPTRPPSLPRKLSLGDAIVFSLLLLLLRRWIRAPSNPEMIHSRNVTIARNPHVLNWLFWSVAAMIVASS